MPTRHRSIPKKTQQQLIDEQREWIREHGGDLAGYIERYGPVERGCPLAPRLTRHGPECQVCHGNETYTYVYGYGGEAIYRADMNALRELETKGRL